MRRFGNGDNQERLGLLQEDVDSLRTVPVRNYDVFVNHRGPDVKRTLVSHLSAALKKLNFSCFVDNEEIQIGELAMETIQSAIQHSKIHISIFSPRYVESRWCLDELLLLMDCFHTKTSHLFLPIFFNVTPSDLRLLTPSRESCYNSEFEKHGGSYAASDINDWKKALHEASTVKGYIFPDDFQGFEAGLVESILSKVIEVLSRATLLHGPEHPVGVDEKLRKALDRMKGGAQNIGGVRKFGIYGMGGLGKTTLAKSIYNRIHREFESACFMQNVSESCKDTSKGLVGLQKELLQELLKTYEISIPNTARGKQMMRERLEGKKVLIILDDVSEKEQLDELMPPYDCCLGKGSKIVITTRDQQVLSWAQAEARLPMEGLSRDLALKLFNLHAFLSREEPSRDRKQLQTEPSGDFKRLAEKVADACQGLPLALEVLGSYLRGKDISKWEATVEVLEKDKMVDPQRKVTAILKISFNALRSAEEKEMFLDIACFLFQEPKDKAMRIWRSNYGDAAPELHLENLICKCLVKLDKNGDLTMHDLLRDMGQEIVDNSRNDYWEKSHLWREEEVDYVLKKRKGTSFMRGLSSNFQKEWDISSFNGMDELKLLVLNKVTLTGDFRKIPQELRWFQLRNCPLKIPLSLHLDKVAVLDLEGSNLTSFRCGDCTLQNLKELNLNNCSNLIELVIDFSKSSKSLEILILSGCVNLKRIPDSISKLSSSLRYLDVSQCSKLTSLPDAIGKLTVLCKIGLDGVGVSTLPQSFGSLSSLISLRLHHSSELRELPSTIGKLTKLVHFRISDCNSVSQLPDSIGHLTNLVELHVHYMVKLVSLPRSIRSLRWLRVLNLQGCTNLLEIRELPSSLTSLVVGGCRSLKYLDMGGCEELKTLPDGLESLCKLSSLELSRCTSLVHLPTGRLEKLTSLKTLNLVGSLISVVQDNQSPWIQKMVALEEVVMEVNKVPDFLFKPTYLQDHSCSEIGEVNIAPRRKLPLRFSEKGEDHSCSEIREVAFVIRTDSVQDYRSSLDIVEVEEVKDHCCLAILKQLLPDFLNPWESRRDQRDDQRDNQGDQCLKMWVERVVPGWDIACRGIVCCLMISVGPCSWKESKGQVFPRAEVVGKDGGHKFSQDLCSHSFSEEDYPGIVKSLSEAEGTQPCLKRLHVAIYRASHPLVASLRGGDTIRVHTSRAIIKEGFIKLMYGENEMEETLQHLSMVTAMPNTKKFRFTHSF